MTTSAHAWIADDGTDARLDRHVSAHLPEWSRTRLQEAIAAGLVLVDDKPRKASFRLVGGERIEVLDLPSHDHLPVRAEPQDIPLHVLWEDDAIAVIDKPAGLTVHPGAGCPDGTLANALAFRYRNLSGLNGPLRPGIVHRLDKDTSGLLVVALTDEAHRRLSAQLLDKSLGRSYDALVWGLPEDGRIEAPVGRHPTDRIRMAVVPDGRPAATHLHVQRPGAPVSLVECRLETGRTHQIRVHLAHRGFPVVGDPVYGGDAVRLGSVAPLERTTARSILARIHRQCLHARQLRLVHPVTAQEMEFSAPWPEDFAAAVTAAFPAIDKS